jgi:rod shape-determining protein MreB
VGDIYTNGIVLTGGGAMIKGLPELIKNEIKVNVVLADNPVECVAIGTGKSFDYIEDLQEGFTNASTYKH